jgi:hypothetical protein
VIGTKDVGKRPQLWLAQVIATMIFNVAMA